MQAVNQLIMIIPVVLTLESQWESRNEPRLATAANIGEFDDLLVRHYDHRQSDITPSRIALILGRFIPRSRPSAPSPLSGTTSCWFEPSKE